MSKKRVAVGMSGGVDSSVSALILKEQGYEVTGVTMDFWHDDEGDEIYKNLSDAKDAKKVCDHIGIPHLAVNFTKEFKASVEADFVSEYIKGRTPNPCIVCNPTVKWGALLKWADELGIEYIATGHYANIVKLSSGRLSVSPSSAAGKDQSYVLYRLSQEQLARTLFPVGDMEKNEVRRIAKDAGLPVAEKPDSQDICFIDDCGYADYLEKALCGMPMAEGDFVDTKGNVLGRHKGIYRYTYGQRKGLGISAGKPMFVKAIDVERNEVVLSDDDELYTDTLFASGIYYMGEARFLQDEGYLGKIRYSHAKAPCTVEYVAEDKLRIRFLEPVRAVTPGQAVVLYKDGHIAGGATID